jgi:hypothetical protein
VTYMKTLAPWEGLALRQAFEKATDRSLPRPTGKGEGGGPNVKIWEEQRDERMSVDPARGTPKAPVPLTWFALSDAHRQLCNGPSASLTSAH